MGAVDSGWTPPDGLGGPTPRRVRFTRSGAGWLALSILMLLGSTALSVYWIDETRRSGKIEADINRRILTGGWEADAIVTSVRPFAVGYTFRLSDREYRGGAVVEFSFSRTLHVGATIPVRFLVTDPRRNYPRAWPPRPYLYWYAPLRFTWIGWAIGFAVLIWVLRERRLLVRGLPAAGEVDDWGFIGREYTANYFFVLPDGRKVRSRAGNLAKRPAVGDILCIIYDPRKPRRNHPYPLGFVRLAGD